FVHVNSFERTLLIRVTEFLSSLNNSMEILTKNTVRQDGAKETTYSRLMPTLYLLELDIVRQKSHKPDMHISNYQEFIQALIVRTEQYYADLSSFTMHDQALPVSTPNPLVDDSL
ncbi:MAG: hypothetical protein Q8K36_05020, partial [Alphaproteobacteria bacterium]|nr:hypothetical protein [Alphaproteobacteria bacterium]